MKFCVDDLIFDKFPELYLGVTIAKGIDNSDSPDKLWDLIRDRQKTIRGTMSSDTLSQYPRIATWRQAYSAFGAKPKKYKSSVESLYRMVLKGIDLRPINAIVDIYNYISLKHMVPLGGDDTSRIEGNIELRFAEEGERFQALNSEEVELTKYGEVIYADEIDVLCRRWNWRECDKTKMSEATKEAMLVVEGLPPVGRGDVETIAEELCRLVQTFCGGESRFEILHREKAETVISL
jgi:lysyl-tRNA synthetase class 2